MATGHLIPDPAGTPVAAEFLSLGRRLRLLPMVFNHRNLFLIGDGGGRTGFPEAAGKFVVVDGGNAGCSLATLHQRALQRR